MVLFPVGPTDIASFIETAQQVVLLQSASIGAPPLLDSLRSVRKRNVRVNVLLGPKPDYLMVNGKPLVVSRPYDANAGAELSALSEMGAELFINPLFNELRATQVQPGVTSHATYMVADRIAALVCTGAFSDGALQHERNLCLRSDDQDVIKALTALFFSEFDESLSVAKKSEFVRAARAQLIVCPKCEADLIRALSDIYELTIRVSGFGALPKIQARLLEFAPRLRLLLPEAYRGQHPFEAALRRAGAEIRFVPERFDGLTWVGKTKSGHIKALVGSMQLNENSLNRSREVAVPLRDEIAINLGQLLDAAWGNAR